MTDQIIDINELKHDAETNVEVLALKRTIIGLQTELKTLQADYGDLKGYFRDLDAVALSLKIPSVPNIYKPTEKDILVKTPCVVVLHWTDWHYGAVQEADEIEQSNQFSPEILKQRIRNLCDDFIRWVAALRKSYIIEECIVLDTGDNISGDIHHELQVTNAFPTPVQAFECGILKGEALAMLSPHFKKLRMEFIVPDNHSRLTKKPQSKQQGLNSHNYVVGHVGKLVSSNQSNLEFNIHLPHVKVVEVSTRKYLITHGHGVQSWMGIPYYGIERKIAKEAMGRLIGPDENRFHKVIQGHYHAPLTHPYFWIGGSASGTDAFDHKCGRRSIPIQCAWVVHPVHAEFNRTDFLLREDKKGKRI